MARHVIITHPPKADADVAAALAEYGSATVHEAMGRIGYTGHRLKPIQQGVSVSGTAVTVSVAPGDNLMIHAAIEQAGEGDVIVVVPTTDSAFGFIGELMATQMQVRGVRAYVTSGGVRDTTELRRMGFPVWSKFVSSEGTVKDTPGSVNVPVVLEGVVVHPGDVVVADDDGVTIVPRLLAAEALEASKARAEKESRNRERYYAGETSMEINKLRPVLEQLGVEYVEYTPGD